MLGRKVRDHGGVNEVRREIPEDGVWEGGNRILQMGLKVLLDMLQYRMVP
jgi:hypothetical protein